MSARSWPYVILVSVTVLVVGALVVAPWFVTLEAMQTSEVANDTYIDSTDYDTDPETAVEDSTTSLRIWMAPAVVLALAAANLIAARQGRGR